MYHPDLIRHPDNCPALVLNADYTPLSYYPLSLWPWQTAIKAVFLDRVDIIESYEKEVRSPTSAMKLPSVIALKQYVKPSAYPAFTRFNLFLRDRFTCQYCGTGRDLTFDHVVPRAYGGKTTWENVSTACAPCNLKKGGRTPAEAHMALFEKPYRPTSWQLQGDDVAGFLDRRPAEALQTRQHGQDAAIALMRGAPQGGAVEAELFVLRPDAPLVARLGPPRHRADQVVPGKRRVVHADKAPRLAATWAN